MIYIIAGSYHQSQNWQKRHMESRAAAGEKVYTNEYMYVSKANDLRGVRNPHGVFIGTWKTHPDIVEIVRTLRIQTDKPTNALDKIWESIKPVTKLKRVNGGWINESAGIQDAADMLAKEIDEEVLRTLHKRVNGGMVNASSPPSVPTDNMIPMLVKALQELNAKVTALEKS